MAVDKRAARRHLEAKRHLEEMLMAMNNHRNDRAAYSDSGNAAGEERCERALKYNYARIRSHCARHDLELPHDVPSEGAE